MVMRKAGAAIAACCTTIVKPAPETPLTTLAIAYLAEQAGLPNGVLNVVTTKENLARIGQALCDDPIVKKLSFTGSTSIGKLLMAQCAATLKRLSMELGGNSSFMIFADCDIDHALATVMSAKVRNSGQTCVGANRIYVQRGIHDRFSAKLVENFKAIKTGDGFAEGVTIGPLNTKRSVDKAAKHVQDAVSKGASLLHGGSPIPGVGFFSSLVW